MAETSEDSAGADDTKLGTTDADVVGRWKAELEAARKGPHKRWIERAKKAIRRYRDENVDDLDGGSPKRNAQFNVLWSNAQTVAPSIYSRPPTPVVERRYLDRDVIGRAAATILQRVLSYQIESPESDFHETMRQCRTDYMLVAMGSAWLRYEAEYKPAAPQHQDEQQIAGDESYAAEQAEGGEDEGDGYNEEVVGQKICVDYCHWSDELFSPARFWQELTWRAKRAYYTRRQAVKKFGKEHGTALPLKVTRGKKQNDITDQIKEAIGKAEVWQIWDFVERKIVYICEDYGVAPLDIVEDDLGLRGFTPAARPVRGTTTNDSIYPIPDYTIWHDQAAELDNLTARIAALTRAIKAAGVFDASVPELARLLQEGMENKLIGVTNWAKLTQKGGLPGAVSLLPIKELSDALTALYLARAQVKNDLYEISGTSDIVRGASDPNETAAAQKLKGQFSAVRGGDRKSEFDRFVRDTMLVMAEIAVEHFTNDTLWLMSDFQQWAADQDLKAYMPAPFMPPSPMMGHNGGPPLDMPAPPMAPPAAPPASMPPVPGLNAGNGGAAVNTPAAPMPAMVGSGLDGVATSAPSQVPPSPAPMASSPGNPPIQGLAMPGAPGAPMPGMPSQMSPSIPPPTQEMLARELFNKAVKLLRDDKMRSFRVQIESDSTVEPDQQQEQQSRVEFLGAVTQFLAQAAEMGGAYPQLMPVLGKFLLFGARGFKVGRDLESSLEAMVTDLEKQARNPAPKKPSPDEVKAQAIKDKAEADKELAGIKMQGEQQKLQMEMQRLVAELQAEQQRLQMEMQKLQMQLQAEREKIQIKREESQIKLQTTQQQASIKQAEGEQSLALKTQEGQIDSANMERAGDLEAEGMERKAQHDERQMQMREQQAKQKTQNGARK